MQDIVYKLVPKLQEGKMNAIFSNLANFLLNCYELQMNRGANVIFTRAGICHVRRI